MNKERYFISKKAYIKNSIHLSELQDKYCNRLNKNGFKLERGQKNTGEKNLTPKQLKQVTRMFNKDLDNAKWELNRKYRTLINKMESKTKGILNKKIVFDYNTYLELMEYLKQANEAVNKVAKSEGLYKELEKDPQEIYGITTKIPESLKDIAIKVYNTGLDEEEQIDIESFNSYFGEVYLNNVTLIQVNKTVFILSIIPLILSILFLIIFITTKLKTKKELNKIDLQKIPEENLYYNKDKHFLLTKQYLIINQKKLNIIPLNNIIKIYEKDIKGFNTIIEKQLWITNKNNQEIKIISFAQPNLKEIKKIINLICRENKKIINENNEA